MTTPPNIWTAPAMGGDVTRLPCCIPFCRRTTEARNGLQEWICPKHWRTTSKKLRALYRKRVKRRNAGDLSQEPKLSRIWDKLKNQAMEGAMY